MYTSPSCRHVLIALNLASREAQALCQAYTVFQERNSGEVQVYRSHCARLTDCSVCCIFVLLHRFWCRFDCLYMHSMSSGPLGRTSAWLVGVCVRAPALVDYCLDRLFFQSHDGCWVVHDEIHTSRICNNCVNWGFISYLRWMVSWRDAVANGVLYSHE